jgi:hypothetical protein
VRRVKGDAHYPDARRGAPAAGFWALVAIVAVLAGCVSAGGGRHADSEAYGLGDDGIDWLRRRDRRRRLARVPPGDLVYFNPNGGRVSHIGIYVGEGRFVHAPSRGGTVRLDSLASDYWTRHFVTAKRVLL